MNTRTLRLGLAIGIASAFTLTASAAPNKMAKLDLNGDTFVDQTEFISAANQKFANMDTDGNGAVTKEERKAFRALKREERAQRRFERQDANGDGVISEQESQEARAARDEKREIRRTERQAEREARGNTGEPRKNREGKRKRFNPDSNEDGVIDVAENTAAAEQAFARMDKNQDGLLSADELKRKKRRGKRKQRRSGQ